MVPAIKLSVPGRPTENGADLMIRILIGALVCVLVTTPALARNITNEVQYFRNVDVIYSENAHVCGFKDREPYVSFVKERLTQMDMPHYADAVTNVVVSITASAGGLVRQKCIVFAQVRLEAPFKASFIDLSSYPGEDQTFQMLSERNYEFPIVFWGVGVLYKEYQQEMRERTLGMLGGLLDRLEQARIAK
jgi:hypothetical protein